MMVKELQFHKGIFNYCFFLGTSEIDLSSPLNYGTPSSRLGVGTPRTPGAAMTPIRPRPDVRSERKMRTVNLADGSSDPVIANTNATSLHQKGLTPVWELPGQHRQNLRRG